jgi:type I restriction enzyme S subunit
MQLTKTKFKQTEVGLIPEDWEINELNNISKITRLAGYEYSTVWMETPYGEIIALRGFNIGENKIIKRDFVRISNKLSMRLIRSRLYKGDVIYPCVGTIGNAVVIEEDDKYHIQQNIAKITPAKDFLDSKYLAYYLMSSFGYDEIQKFNGSSSQPNILVGSLRKYSIISPPLPEQKAIAHVLSDTDSLIQTLEQKLAKKRAIKQGAMQQLLMPKEEWVVRKLGEIGKTFGGLSGKSKPDFSNGNSKYIPFMNIMSNPVIDTTYLDSVFIKKNEIQNKAIKGDLFFNGSSETPEEVGLCSVLLENIPNLYLNSFCFGFRLFNQEEFNGLYLSYFFRSDEGRKLFYSLAQGATRYNLSKANFLKLEFSIPNPKEQTRIATILSDMDLEIAQLEQKLDKYILLKQGLMQELLTGRIRLIKT